MDISIFLKLDGIEGEATDDGHVGEIKLMTCNFGAVNFSEYNNGSATISKGQARMHPITVNKELDKASVALFKACASGKVISTGIVTFQANIGDNKKIDFLIYELDNVVVNNYSLGVSGNATENFSLTYAKITQTYDQRDSKGGSKGKITGYFDVLKNTAG